MQWEMSMFYSHVRINKRTWHGKCTGFRFGYSGCALYKTSNVSIGKGICDLIVPLKRHVWSGICENVTVWPSHRAMALTVASAKRICGRKMGGAVERREQIFSISKRVSATFITQEWVIMFVFSLRLAFISFHSTVTAVLYIG